MNPTHDPQRGFLLHGTKTHISLGRLQTPEEFTEDCLQLKQRPLFDCWALSAQMSDETVRVLQSPLVPNAAGLAMMESEEGILYPVVTLQSAGLQVRLLLSLANVQTQQWFRAVTSAGVINIALEIPEVGQVAVITMPCEVPRETNIEELIRRCATPDREVFVRDAGQMGRSLAELDALPSILTGFENEDVRLVFVLETGPGSHPMTPRAESRVLN